MTKKELNGMWNYYLSIERDLSNTSRYIEPEGQENVHSFEFAKLLILACTEIESVFKAICLEIESKQVEGNIGSYKGCILKKYPKLIEAEVTITRLEKTVRPFEEWNNSKLSWWDAYQKVKHNRGDFFVDATYLNATMSISALYILILYLAKINNVTINNFQSEYISSEYGLTTIVCLNNKHLPDF